MNDLSGALIPTHADVAIMNVDIAAIARIDAVHKILEVICKSTGMGFSAVAHVTETKWIACAVKDEIAFGLKAGGELELKSTICDEIRGSGQLVVIDDVSKDAHFCGHHTPARYGFKSYISVPIVLPDGRFFGTLCAIDPNPAKVNTPATIGMFKLFADLIAIHLDNERRRADEKATEAALADARLRSDSALLAAEIGTYFWDIRADRVYGDQNFARIFGVRLDDNGELPIAEYLTAIHEEDRPATMEKIQRAVADGGSFEAEYRITRGTTNGDRWVIARGRVERDESGTATRFSGVVLDLSERKKAESALRKSEARFRSLFDSIDDGFCELEIKFDEFKTKAVDFRYIDVNPAFERQTGMVNAPGKWVREALPNIEEYWFERYGKVALTGEPTRFTENAKDLGRWFDAYAFRIGAAVDRRVAVVFQDVTARRAAEQALRISESESRFLSNLGEESRLLADPTEVHALASRMLAEHLHAQRVAYFEIVGDDYVVERDYVNNVRSLVGRNPVAAWGQEIVDLLVKGRTIVLDDAPAALARTDAERAAFADWHIAALISVPLIKSGSFVAGLTVHSATPRVWTREEVSLIEQTADRTWAAVERARAMRSVHESEARLQALVIASSDAVYRMNPDWSEMTQLMGRDFLGDTDKPDRSWMERYIHVDDQPRVRAAIAEAVQAKEPFHLEHRVLRVDGRVGWTASRAVPLLDNAGQITEWFGAASDISDRKNAEADRDQFVRDLGVSEQRRRMAAEAANVGFFNIDPAAATLESDVPFRQLFTGSDQPITYEQAFAMIHPDDREMVRTRVAAALDPANGRPYEAEYRVVHPDGTVVWIAARGRSIFIGAGSDRQAVSFDGTVADVTDRIRADGELAFQRYRLELIFKVSPAAMALWCGDDLVFDQVNPGYQNLYPGRPLLGLPLLEALPELRGQGVDELLRRVLRTGEPVVGRETLVKLARTIGGPAEDRYFDFSYLQVRDPDGKPWAVYDHAVDVTDRVVARQAVEKSQAELRQALVEREQLLASEQSARAEAEQAGRMKDEFLATLSHELRTPLNAIVGWIQILKTSGNDPDDLKEGLAVIDRNARAQTQIIEDILDMSRIISGKLRLDVQHIDLSSIIRAGVDTVQPAADAKAVKIQALLDPSAGPISGDPNRLHQIFWNLLSNAVKFTPRGGKVQVLLERVNSHVEISIIDTGEGIDAHFLPHVFDRFRQADASTTRRHGGLGLGLAIVKQLVELHGGSVRVKSPGKGSGSTFIVSLPLTVIHAEQLEPMVVREHPQAGAPLEHRPDCGQLEGVDVVVVDDEPDGVAVIKRLLEECGAKVRTAVSAAEAFELIQAKAPTVLVSDIGMPDEDGYSLIRRVRSLPPASGGRVRAVALTAYARAADRVKALEAGFHMHLSKPVEPTELVATVAAMAKMEA